MGRTRTGVAHCPSSNLRLGSGIARIPDLVRAGARVGLAVDGSASNDSSDLLAEIRLCLLVHRLRDVRSMSARLVCACLRGGAEPRTRGRRTVDGCAADLAIFDVQDTLRRRPARPRRRPGLLCRPPPCRDRPGGRPDRGRTRTLGAGRRGAARASSERNCGPPGTVGRFPHMTDAPLPRCPHRPPCGGCALLGLPLEEQRAWKRGRAADALARFPSLRGVEVRDCVPAPSATGYRTRVKFAVARASGRRAALGLFRPGSHECSMPVPGGARRLAADRRAARAAEELPVRHVCGGRRRRAHVTLVVDDRAIPDGPMTSRARSWRRGGVQRGLRRRPRSGATGAGQQPSRSRRAAPGRGDRPGALSPLPGAFFQADPRPRRCYAASFAAGWR